MVFWNDLTVPVYKRSRGCAPLSHQHLLPMAEPRDGGSGAVASVAIVVLVIVALIAGYFLFFQGGDSGPSEPDLQIELNGGGGN
jgi:hypothetical protein